METLTLSKVIALASVDAVNPCALAVLALMLMAIMGTSKSRKRVLASGLSFSLAVFVGYLFYGVILVKLFSVVQAITSIRLTLYKILGAFALILGALQLKDTVWYRPGGVLTEMPMSWRPKAKMIISHATGPKSAFLVGLFVTIFLLPCTMGPYLIMAGIASFYTFLKALLWLLLYNAIFITPMIAITILVYIGLRVADVKKWRDENIRTLHFIESVILIALGFAMVVGLV